MANFSFRDIVSSAIAAAGAFFVGGPGLAGKVFITNLVLGGVQKALAKDPEGAGRGRASDRTVTSRDPVAPRAIVYGKVRIGGTYVYMHSTGDDSRVHFVIALCEGPVEGIDEIYFNNEVAVEADGTIKSKYSSVLTVSKVLGETDQAADSTAVLLTPDSGNGAWTNDHRLRGVAYLYLALDFSRDKWPQGAPDISAVVRGRNTIWDSRTGTTGYSTNAALCLADYLMDDRFGLNLSQSDIDTDALDAAANVCDESVSLKGGGSESRYTCNGVVVSSEKPKNIIADLANSMAGWATNIGGVWHIRAGDYRAPSLELDETNLRSGLSFTTRASRRERLNSVRGTFVAPENDWQPADFPPWQSASEITEDGETIWKDIELPFTTSPSMATRLARIEVERMRREQTFSATFDLTALQLVAGDTVQFTYDRFGFAQKVFEVVDLRLVDDEGALAVELQLREMDANVYDWDSADEGDVSQAPETDLPDPFTVAAPTNLALASGDAQLFPKKDGTIVSRIKATWDQASGAFVDRYQVQYKKSSDSEWQNAGDVDDDNRVAYAWEVEDDVNYDVRVRAINQLGVRSAWTLKSNHTVEGKSTPPPNPDTFNVTALSDGTRYFEFTLSNPPADLAGFEVRYVAGSSTDYDAMTPLTPQGRLVFSPFESNDVPSGLHSFGVKAVDTSGNYSTGALFIEADLPLPRLSGVLLQRFEKSLEWPGTRNSMFRDTDNNLYAVAASDGTWGDLSGTAWSDASGETWYSWTNRESPVSYETEVVDLGADAAFTPRALVSATGSITREMKTGTDADGGVVGSYGALSSVTARYIQIRVTITGTTPILKNLTTLLDGQVEQTVREDVATATESSVWFNRIATGHFQVAASGDTEFISRAQIIAFQSVTVPHSWSLESKSATVNGNPAAEFKVYDNNGNLADATIDIEINGPKAA